MSSDLYVYGCCVMRDGQAAPLGTFTSHGVAVVALHAWTTGDTHYAPLSGWKPEDARELERMIASDER